MTLKAIISISTLLVLLGMVLSLSVAITPSVASAQAGLIPCGTETITTGAHAGEVSNPCKWSDFFTLVTNVTNYLIILGAAVSALAFGWAGILMMTAGGEMGKIEQAKSIFVKVLIGFILMLAAWLIVHPIDAGFIASGYFDSSGIQPI